MQTPKGVNYTISVFTWSMQMTKRGRGGLKGPGLKMPGHFGICNNQRMHQRYHMSSTLYLQADESLQNLELMLIYFFFKTLQEGKSANLPH